MKSITKQTKKHITVQQVTGAILTMLIILTATSFAYNTFAESVERKEIEYYKTAEISDFYEQGYIIPDDACAGDSFHHWVSERTVKQTETGWKAELTRELFRLDGENAGKVYDEFAIINIEPRAGEGKRRQELPFLKEGEYQWQLSFVLYLPYGVDRPDVPIFYSEPFLVTNCE